MSFDNMPTDPLGKLVAKIEKEVDEELSSSEIPLEKHGRPIGYHLGCKGPLCRKQHRDRQRRPDQRPANPWLDDYLELRMRELQQSLKKGSAA